MIVNYKLLKEKKVMQLELNESERVLMKWAISMMSTQLLQNIIKTKQQMKGLTDDQKMVMENGTEGLSPEQVANLKEIMKGQELKDNVANWQVQLKELKDLDKKIPASNA